MTRRLATSILLLTLAFGATAYGQQSMPVETVTLVDINSAPLEEIEAVVLNDLLARKIIDNRPYANKRQLLTRRLISLEAYDKIKDRIIARRGGGPR